MMNLESLSYGVAALAFFILSLLLLTSWRGHLQGALLVAATVVTTLWAGESREKCQGALAVHHRKKIGLL